MISVNLIPSERKFARARRTRIRRWLWAGGVYALALAGALVWARYRLGVEPDAIDARLVAVAGDIQSAERKAESLRAVLAAAKKELAASRAVTDHPDWSILLGLVSGLREGEIVLDSCELAPIEPVPGAAPTGRRYLLRLGGIGREQPDIPRFVLRLEQTGLFERVAIVDSRARSVGEAEVHGFRVECTLRDPGGVGP